MKRLLFLISIFSVLLASCGKDKEQKMLDETFNSMSESQKMEYLMKEKKPDSVALIISDIAMGNIKGASINLNEAYLFAIEHYDEDDQIKFLEEMKKYESQLPLDKKMKYVKLSGMEDMDQYGYEMGLSYVGAIREDKKDSKQIKQELDEFKKASASDPEFFKRFVKGFKLALEEDRGRDLDDKIYLEFINYQDSI